MRTEIKELHQRLKTTTVYVTHDQIEAMTMADKIVVMHDGVVEQMGKPLQVYDHPANLFVAEFIGSPAVKSAAWHGGGEARGPAVRLPEGIALPLPVSAPVRAGQSVVYGIRPEHLRPSRRAASMRASMWSSRRGRRSIFTPISPATRSAPSPTTGWSSRPASGWV
jgi:multiple sugar transport system ATP-binding protein